MLRVLPGFFLLLTANCEQDGLLNRKEAGLDGFELFQPPLTTKKAKIKKELPSKDQIQRAVRPKKHDLKIRWRVWLLKSLLRVWKCGVSENDSARPQEKFKAVTCRAFQ